MTEEIRKEIASEIRNAFNFTKKFWIQVNVTC